LQQRLQGTGFVSVDSWALQQRLQGTESEAALLIETATAVLKAGR
jgi:hypothetical protein